MDSGINVGESDKTDEELAKEEAEGRARQLGHTVWHTPQLRHLIVDQLDRKELLVALCLDKTSFPVVAAKLYREIKWDEYEHFSRRHISVSVPLMMVLEFRADAIVLSSKPLPRGRPRGRYGSRTPAGRQRPFLAAD